jgi:hypothetical protein
LACRHILSRFGAETPELAAFYGLEAAQIAAHLPANPAIQELPNALAAAHAHYGVKE